MGNIVTPICSCNHPFPDLFLGKGGMRNFDKACYAPFTCGNCGIITIRNILEHHHQCENCNNPLEMIGDLILINDTNQIEIDSDKYIFTWEIDFDKTYILENKLYVCPKCKTLNLKFIDAGCWD